MELTRNEVLDLLNNLQEQRENIRLSKEEVRFLIFLVKFYLHTLDMYN